MAMSKTQVRAFAVFRWE